jgi:ribosomal protein S18 acetylase RimI-like enzyme
MSDDITYRLGDAAVDTARLHELLRDTYWARGRTAEHIARAVRNSFCASAWRGERMVGFARLVTDFVAHAYLADVIVEPELRRRGIATRLVRMLIGHEAVATCHVTLHTRDAQAVYRPLGFADLASMVRRQRRPWSAP